jgi:hypothetical protein
MAGHSRSKNGVASLAYVPAIHVLNLATQKDVDTRHKAGHDEGEIDARQSRSYAAIFSSKSISTSGQVMCGLWLASISLVPQPSRRARSRNWRKRSSGGWRVA